MLGPNKLLKALDLAALAAQVGGQPTCMSLVQACPVAAQRQVYSWCPTIAGSLPVDAASLSRTSWYSCTHVSCILACTTNNKSYLVCGLCDRSVCQRWMRGRTRCCRA